MSKRAQDGTGFIKPTKRAKKSIDDFGSQSLLTDDDNSQSSTASDSSMQHFIQIDQEELKQWNSQIEDALSQDSDDQRMNELTNMFKKIINSKSKQKLSSLFTALVEHLNEKSTKMDDKLVSQIASLLSMQIESLPLIVLKNSIDLFLAKIKSQKPYNQKCMDLFVELFKYIQKLPMADMDKNQTSKSQDHQYTGSEYISRKVHELFNPRWTQATAMNVIHLIRRINLDQAQIKLVLSKLFDSDEIQWTYENIPKLINSILQLTNKTNRMVIFEDVLKFMNNLRKKQTENESQAKRNELVEAEIASIMHMTHLIKSDHLIGKDLLKIIKNKLNRHLVELVQPFTFALMLALIKLFSNQDGAVELLKQIVLRIYESELNWKKHLWIIKCLTDEEKKLSSCLTKPSKCRLFASEITMSGLIHFLFDFLDTHGVRMTRFTNASTIREHVTIYASEMLRDLFKHTATSRIEILNNLAERIFSSNSTKAVLFIDQLSILVQTGLASAFQDYFRKFMSRFEHMIHMSPVLALEFINSIKPLLKHNSTYQESLINILKKSIFQSDLNVRKVGLNGLICLLNSTKLTIFLPSSQASQSMSLSQSQSQLSRTMMSQEKNAERNCLEIFLSLRRCMTQQADIRSRLYQSCFNLIEHNKTLVGPTLNLLLTNLENYLIKIDSEVVIDLKKCVKLSEKNEIDLIEPIDVLLHALHLCDNKFRKSGLLMKFQDQLDEDTKKHSDLIQTYFLNLRNHLVQQTPQYLLDTYKSQVASFALNNTKVRADQSPLITSTNQTSTQLTSQRQRATQKQSTQAKSTLVAPDLATSMPIYQCLLGTYEVLIEYLFTTGSFKSMREMSKKFNQFYEHVYKQFSGANTVQEEKKPAKKKTTNSKKKENKNPNESQNESICLKDENKGKSDEIMSSFLDLSTSAATQSGFLDSTETARPKSAPLKASAKKALLAKFNYVHRISYSCLLKLVKIYFSNPSEYKQMAKEYNECDESIEEFATQLRIDENFHNYLMKVINQQLEFILCDANQMKTTIYTTQFVYDCESFNDNDTFKFLSQLWVTFWQQMNSKKCPNSECDSTQFYCNECIKFKTVYIKILGLLRKIVHTRFSPKLKELFSHPIGDESSQSNASSSNQSIVAVNILDACRLYVDKCLSSQQQFNPNAFKLATSIVELMYDIGTSITLQVCDFAVMFKWAQQTLSNDYIADSALVKALVKYFIYVTWNKNSSGALMKYICNDLVLLFGSNRNDASETICSSEQSFSSLNADNSLALIPTVCDEISNILSIFDWFISFKADNTAMLQFYRQLTFILECIKCLLTVDFNSGISIETIIKTICKFYTFMISFCKNICTRQISEEEEKNLKLAVDCTAKRCQNQLNHLIRFIQNAKSSSQKDKKEKASGDEKQKGKGKESDALTAAKLIKCSKMIPNLVYLVEQYKQQLKLLNKHFQNKIDFTENFDVCLRDFKITLSFDEVMSQIEDNNDIENSNEASESEAETNESQQNEDEAENSEEENERSKIF